jgi:hypothetical protein
MRHVPVVPRSGEIDSRLPNSQAPERTATAGYGALANCSGYVRQESDRTGCTAEGSRNASSTARW